jgi:hypothetical protein
VAPLALAAAALALTAAPPSPDPYAASLAYAQCLRAHGVPHPLPDAKGDFELTPTQEARLRAVPKTKRTAAMEACFHFLKGLNLKPLTPGALARARAVVADLGGCLDAHGYPAGEPVARNLTKGRAFFGFDRAPVPHADTHAGRARLVSVEHACEREVRMAARIDAIVAEDRETTRGDL